MCKIYVRKFEISSSKLLFDFRICDSNEQPTDLFAHSFGPAIFLLLVLSLASSALLQLLGNYYNLYQWSYIICCKRPITHVSMIHDYLKHSNLLKENLRREMCQIFTNSLKIDSNIKNLKDILHGSTCMHYAIDNKMYNELGDLVSLGADFMTRNDYGEIPFNHIIEQLQNSESSELEKITLKNLLRRIEQEQKNENDKVSLVWLDPPMHKACRENKVHLLFFFTLIGGHWGAQDSIGHDVQICLLHNIEEDKITLNQCNYLVKKYLANQHDQYGQSILHYAVKLGFTKSLKILLDCYGDVNKRKTDNGFTPTHNAAKYMQLECLKLLLSYGAKVNSRCIQGETPLHEAVLSGDVSCAEVLIESNADVNAKSNIGFTPIHVAALFGRADCLQLLINSNGGKFDG